MNDTNEQRSSNRWPEIAGAALGVTIALGAAAFTALQIANGLPHVHIELPYGNPDNGSIAQPLVHFVGSIASHLR